MLTAIAIGIPIFMIVAGTLAALAFSVSPAEENAAALPARSAAREEPAAASLNLSQVTVPWSEAAQTSTASSTSVDALLLQIEAHLKAERQAAAAFAADPSSRALWLN